MNTRQRAAIDLIEAYQLYKAATALFEASHHSVDLLLCESNDIFFAACNCDDTQLKARDTAQRHFEYALIDFRSLIPQCNPVNWLDLAWQYKRSYTHEYNVALHNWLETV